MTKVFKNITLFLVAGLLFVGCEAINNSNKTQRGAVIGAASGAILGAILGNNVGSGGNSELGAVIGTAVGGAAGAVIGNQMDRQAKTLLNKMVNVLKEYPDTNVIVAGHTDSKGKAAYNMGLSERRAKAVTNFFTSNGLNASRFTTKWFGATQPAYDNATEEGRAKNRRVNIAIIPNEKMKEDAKKQAQQ